MSESSPQKQTPLQRQADAIQESAGRALQIALQEARARTGDQVLPSRQWFGQLPDINRWLLGSGSLCVTLGLFCLIGVPLLSYANNSAQAMIFPYTAEGKRQTCLSNLQQISQALAQYRDDYDARLPVAEYSQSGQRKTWTALLRERGMESDSFICPTHHGQDDGQAVSSYGFNPILFGTHVEEDGADKVVVLGDRGEAHDAILFPPFATWPAVPKEASPGNFDFRHGGNGGSNQAAVLYGDGHADTMPDGSWISAASAWGGEEVFAVGLERLEAQYPLLKQIPPTPPQAFKNQKAKLRQALGQLHLLEKQGVANSIANEEIEKRLWKGAGALRVLGDGAFEKQLDADLREYSRQLSKQTGGWKPLEDEGGENLSFKLQFPIGWRVETQNDGRYRTTYFRSPSPYIGVLVERGERNQPTNASVIDFTGMEEGLRDKYGVGYKRIQIGYDTLGGRTVSMWECELKKPDGPKLRKKYYGYSTTWNSTILVCTAPANSYQAWNAAFEQFHNSFEFRE